ncbi:MAG: sugar phosphate isomerase/epimerase [Thermomicrobiales bacterium]|nr:sugar phosphate isomerase/epimerase [Thermomicrobiales bacterium]
MTEIPRDAIALQLYTLRAETAQDLLGVLKRVSEIGYRAVEFAGLQGVEPSLARATLNELGMVAAGAHVPLQQWEHALGDTLTELAVIGAEYGVVPWVPEDRRTSIDDVRRLAEIFNAVASACANRGIRFAFHHHAIEFAPLPGGDGQTMFDVLIAETDPALVNFEIDLYWAEVAGVDLRALLERLSGRVPLVHLKDAGQAQPGEIPPDLPVGEGTLPWSELIPAAMAAGARWWIVEQDNPNPTDPFADAATAFRNLTTMRFG